MIDEVIRNRIAEAVRKDGRSMRSISLAAGMGQHFVQQLIGTGREPGIGQFLALCAELGVTAGSIIHGLDLTPQEEDLARRIARLEDADRRLIEEMVARLSR